jgi:hypothetical protein
MRNVGEKEKNGKREWILLPLFPLCCDMWTNMEQWWVFVVSGGTTGGVQQQQGNASRVSTASRYLIPISPLVNNYFN